LFVKNKFFWKIFWSFNGNFSNISEKNRLKIEII
jgi:hypothetical protein